MQERNLLLLNTLTANVRKLLSCIYMRANQQAPKKSAQRPSQNVWGL